MAKPEAALGATVDGVVRPAGASGAEDETPRPRAGFPEVKLFPEPPPAGPVRSDAAPGPEMLLGTVLHSVR